MNDECMNNWLHNVLASSIACPNKQKNSDSMATCHFLDFLRRASTVVTIMTVASN